MSTRTDKSSIKKQLQSRRAKLLARLGAVSDALTDAHDRDLDDQAIEREGDEVLELLGRADRNEVEALSAALKRLEAGTYGICASCGEAIGESRLLAIPETPLCRACAMENEDLFENMPV